MDVRLQKLLSAAGIASRRAAERLIVEGRVSINGKTVRDLGVKADPDRDTIHVDGRRIRTGVAPRYFLVNKPVGVVTTRSDPQRRPTVLDLLQGVSGYLYPVGRLDYDSEGLLLVTNDGDMAARLTHPRHEVPKVYRARVRGVPDARALDRLARGIPLDGQRTAPATVRLGKRFDGSRGPESILELTLHEGRNRQVRRMCEAVGHPVIALSRIQFGPLRDPRLKPGAFRELTASEIAKLRQLGGGPAPGPTTLPPSRPHTRTGRGPRRPPRSSADRLPRG